ncbi:hypothetical protein [Streptococcus australis]|uniref:hypothetical protein n=1 Tax=Streptococcus australis TaxID=113107 RepID=UPI0018987412|nr:hypothetical protein [Streptococcus australis]MDB8644622.1 hypothetical protein [Streptococcus australis]
MKNKGYSLLLLVPILFLTMVLTSCKIMTSSDYKKAKEVVSSELAQAGLHGKVTITKLSWTALEFPTYHVSYTYSEKTYDDQTVRLENETTFHDDWSSSSIIFLPDYKKVFLEQKSIKNIEEKLEKEIKKQSLGLPIEFSIFLSNFYQEEKEEILDSIASQNLKEGKKDFAGYYQIPFQTLIDQELIRMTIYVDDAVSVKEQDLEEAAKKLDASKLPNGAYSFYYSNHKDDSEDTLSYSFKVKDGKVVFYEDQQDGLENQE